MPGALGSRLGAWENDADAKIGSFSRTILEGRKVPDIHTHTPTHT